MNIWMHIWTKFLSHVGVKYTAFLKCEFIWKLYLCSDQLLNISPVSGVLFPLSGAGASVF